MSSNELDEMVSACTSDEENYCDDSAAVADQTRSDLPTSMGSVDGAAPNNEEGVTMSRNESVATNLTCVEADAEVNSVPTNAGPSLSRRVSVEVVCHDDLEGERGNIAFSCGNWGLRAGNRSIQDNIDLQLKRSPATILGLCEVQEDTVDVLRGNAAVAGNANANEAAVAGNADANAVQRFRVRGDRNFLAVRGAEASSVAIAVRQGIGTEIMATYFELREDGPYGKKVDGSKNMALTRVLGAQIQLAFAIPHFGKRIKVLTVHLHRHTAKREKGFRLAYARFWPYLKRVLLQEGTQILMGDFNMALWRVVPELRLLGVTVTLVAWFPWKSSSDKAGFHHEPMSDSCGIFVIGQDVVAGVLTSMKHLHADDDTGFSGVDLLSTTSTSMPMRMDLGSLLAAIRTKRLLSMSECIPHFVTMWEVIGNQLLCESSKWSKRDLT